jgi:transcriptional regulator with XRE-family HTH domain
MSDDFYKKLGKNIKNLRQKSGMTQQDLADKLNLSLNFIGKIEVAFSKPSLDTVIKIAEGLNVSVSELCNFEKY